MQRTKPGHQIFYLFCFALLIGCSSNYVLMPTPNIYADRSRYPANEVPENLRNSQVELLFVTDRAKETNENGKEFYGAKRSASSAYGSVVVDIGNGETWQELIEASQTEKRKRKLPLRIRSLQEHGRFPETPHPFAVVNGIIVENAQTRAAFEEIAGRFRRDLVTRLAHFEKKEVIVFVHGFNNTFETSAFVLAEIWHFSGRRGVPVLYSWPAASGMDSLVRGR